MSVFFIKQHRFITFADRFKLSFVINKTHVPYFTPFFKYDSFMMSSFMVFLRRTRHEYYMKNVDTPSFLQLISCIYKKCSFFMVATDKIAIIF